jgi:hypothetical protein
LRWKKTTRFRLLVIVSNIIVSNKDECRAEVSAEARTQLDRHWPSRNIDGDGDSVGVDAFFGDVDPCPSHPPQADPYSSCQHARQGMVFTIFVDTGSLLFQTPRIRRRKLVLLAKLTHFRVLVSTDL